MHTTFLWLENSVKTFNLPIVLKLIVYNESWLRPVCSEQIIRTWNT
jgi:hypothetical protein